MAGVWDSHTLNSWKCTLSSTFKDIIRFTAEWIHPEEKQPVSMLNSSFTARWSNPQTIWIFLFNRRTLRSRCSTFVLQNNICIFSWNNSEILQTETVKLNKLIRIILKYLKHELSASWWASHSLICIYLVKQMYIESPVWSLKYEVKLTDGGNQVQSDPV